MDDIYRPHDQTNNVKALKETSWSSRSGLNPTRTTPPCYNNTTLGNRLYPQDKGPNVTNSICWTCKNCSYKCAADCEHCVTQSDTELFWQYSLLTSRQSPYFRQNFWVSATVHHRVQCRVEFFLRGWDSWGWHSLIFTSTIGLLSQTRTYTMRLSIHGL